MKNDRPAPAATYTAASSPYSANRWVRFWFTAIPPDGLHWLRVLCCLLFLGWLLPFAGHQTELFSLMGWADTRTYQEMSQLPGGAPVTTGWSLAYLCGENPALLTALWGAALGTFLLFMLGIATRITSVLTWVFVVSFVANPATLFDADSLLVIVAFYLMIGYLLIGQLNGPQTVKNRLVCNRGTCLSPWSNARIASPSYAANLAVRLIQLHFAIVFITSGLSKLQSGYWWGGAALWFPLHEPFGMNADRLRAEAQSREFTLFFLSLGQYLMLAWLIAFPFFAWKPRWRWLTIGGGAVAWLGEILVYGEPLFGPVYFIGCLSFLAPEQWQALTKSIANMFSSKSARLATARTTALAEEPR